MRAKIRSTLLSLFGDLSWSPPPWLSRFDRTATEWMLAHRRRTLAIALLTVGALFGGCWAWDWYLHRPQPVTVSVELEAPGLPSIKDEKQLPQPLSVKFGESVIRL